MLPPGKVLPAPVHGWFGRIRYQKKHRWCALSYRVTAAPVKNIETLRGSGGAFPDGQQEGLTGSQRPLRNI